MPFSLSLPGVAVHINSMSVGDQLSSINLKSRAVKVIPSTLTTVFNKSAAVFLLNVHNLFTYASIEYSKGTSSDTTTQFNINLGRLADQSMDDDKLH